MTDSPLPLRDLSEPTPGRPRLAPAVTAVVVTLGSTRYLPATLRAVGAQDLVPARVLVVDAGPRADEDVPLLARGAFAALGAAAPEIVALHVPGARTFGDAVRRALGDVAPPSLVARPEREADRTWLWLLHDDSAPESPALSELLRAVEHAPSVAVAGVKQRTWTEPSRLLEVGVRTSRSGRRMTGIEDSEVDQGQHDGREDVLGVGIAGALVRRDVWDELDGPDPALGPFGDGLDLSRRARLAGHRVVVVPSAVVRHAQATYAGLRGLERPGADVDVDADGDGLADDADPRRSFAARRRALLHQRLVTAPLPLVPVVALLALAAGLVRALVRIATKEPMLAGTELTAPVSALLHPAAVVRARRLGRATRRLPRRALRPLQATWRDVWDEWRDRRLAGAEVRRTWRAPSELELRELAALATRRRVGLGALVVLLVAATTFGLGALAGPAASGAALVGPALVQASADLGGLTHAALARWVTGGLGDAGPADPLLAVLVPLTALLGGELARAVAAVLLGSLVLAGLGAWFAAGAATRSVGTRLWAAGVWASAPALLLAVGDGRLGAVLVHAMLPWVALGVARAVGVQRRDSVLSGLATAQREPDEPVTGEDGLDARPTAAPRADAPRASAGDTDALLPGPPDGSAAEEEDVETTRPRGALPPRAPADAPEGSDGSDRAAWSPAAEPLDEDVETTRPRRALPEAAARAGRRATASVPAAAAVAPSHEHVSAATVGPPPSTGSFAAAAGAALALLVVVAGAPALLLPSALVLLVVAVSAPRARGRVVLVLVPSLVVLGPLLVEAAGRGAAGWRLLAADPGPALAVERTAAWEQLLGVPAPATGLVPGLLPEVVRGPWPYLLGGAVLLTALLALLRGAPAARAVRVAWLAAAAGLATAVAGGLVQVAAADGAAVLPWAGTAVSFAGAGLLAAAVLGADGISARLARSTFGWRQPAVAVLATVLGAVPVLSLASWAWQAREGDAVRLATLDRPVVPAVGQQSQARPAASRVLTLTDDADGVLTWQLLRDDGAQLVEVAASTTTRTLRGPVDAPSLAEPDDATAEVQDVVARLAGATSGDVSADLAALAVADVLVPAVAAQPATGTPVDAEEQAALERGRADLVARLDATAGLERITENPAGAIWRVQPSAATPGATPVEVVQSWARVLADGDDPAGGVAVASNGNAVDARVEAGSGDRLLVLAERADPGWRATLDGRPLRAVTDGWRQTFELGEDGGRLVVAHRDPDRTPWLVAQGVVLLLTVLFALPLRRRKAGRR
ncbi:glycosyltransferase [Cellulomonas cellasea]|uniref:GT2 family glycosyltransferase n=1 Tax=Cellulomonas cellasea TaxID=43670 RepID=A0A7W4YBN1_9CELL|nr:glycosyltransferase [Cellulomonas cellasea]MBB2922912.1 GT2 family glycosyltransferase [Cellulomonas cellasea]